MANMRISFLVGLRHLKLLFGEGLKLLSVARGPPGTGFEPRRGWAGDCLSEIREFRYIHFVLCTQTLLLSPLYQIPGAILLRYAFLWYERNPMY